MDEKSDVLSTVEPVSDPDIVNAENGEANSDVPPTATDSIISASAASTDTVISTDALVETLTTNSSMDTFPSEPTTGGGISAPENAMISADALSVADALTSVDDLQTAEELTSANAQALTNALQITTKDTTRSSPSVCQLEEELKRLHEGDPEEAEQTDTSTQDTTKTVNEEKSVTAVEHNAKATPPKPNNFPAKELELDPVEMLSAEEVSKDPVLIRKAQEDLKKIDVLVCGNCHEVFHFLEEFQKHKSGKCVSKSNVVAICEGESKPQVWGFTLWKNRQHKLAKEGEPKPTSWTIYQKWCKLSQSDKDAWITAGQTIQFCSKIGTAKITEFKPKVQPKVEKDPLALDGFDSNKENSIQDNADIDGKTCTSDVIKKTIVKPVRLNSDVTILPSNKNGDANSNKALRTVRSTEKREYVVERIVAKRFNPKRKTWEYQIKWEHFPSEDNTWEPVANLNHCKQMVDEFEEQLRKLKAEKARQQAAGILPKGRGRPIKVSQSFPATSSSSSSIDLTPGRPQRTSKQKALNQVKAWCGNISDADEGGVKRSFEDDDSDDSFEKKMKYEDYSEDSDVDIKPKPQVKKITTRPTVQIIKNGIGKTSPLPQNVLIPDANGIVRINQKQLPSLSTGVYIMSKTAGIIKLDSNTSKVATSGGQTIVKVAPKIGQTQIKIVKRDGGTTTTKQIIQMTPTNKNTTNTPTKMYKPIITKVKKPPEIAPKPAPTKVTVKPKEEVKKPDPPPVNDESDDGLEELPFPENLPLPEPESPPSEFILDPITGKIAGQEYPEPAEEKPEEEKSATEDASLDNIVKLAAADITEEDLKNESVEMPMETDSVSPEKASTPAITKTDTNTSKSTTHTVTTGIKVSTTPTLVKTVKSQPSILNKALAGSQILRKSLMNSSQQPKVQQRILNQSVAARIHNVGSISKSVSHSPSLIRTKPIAPKPKFNIAGPSKIIKHETVSPRNVYSKTTIPGVMRKIGNTTIRSASTGISPQKTQARIIQTSTNIHKASPKKDPIIIRSQTMEKKTTPVKPKTVINMPSLIGDDEPASPSTVTEATKVSTVTTTTSSTSTVQTTAAVTSESSVEPAHTSTDSPAATLTADISSFTLADSENPIFITGDDGTVYQVAGQNEQGQTILITQGSDGQQQCLLVTNEVAEAMETSSEEPQADISMPETATNVSEPLSVNTDADTSDQVVAQVVRTEPPSPGGTHKVVVMLPDGNLMVTQVSPEEYASLELE